MSAKLTRWAAPTLAALGLVDAAYLAVLHYIGEIPPCGEYAGCAQVNTSAYATIFGVPVAALGALLYVGVLGAALWRALLPHRGWAMASLLLYALALAGGLFMAYLTATEVFVIHAVCYWCIALAIITITLLAIVTRDVWSVGARTSPRTS